MAATLPAVLWKFSKTHWDLPAQAWRAKGRWKVLSHQELLERIEAIRSWLQAHGVRPTDRVALLSVTRPEWVQSDLGILAAGAITVPIFPSLPDNQIAAILENSGARIVLVDTDEHADKLPPEFPRLVMDSPSWPQTPVDIAIGPSAMPPADWHLNIEDEATPLEQLATIVYTSGTTAHSRGVMLSHRNILANMDGLDLAAAKDPGMLVGPSDRAVSFLPLSHIFERTVHLYLLFRGVTLFYSDPHQMVDDVNAVRPTVMVSVPRIYERIYAALLARAERPWHRRLLRAGTRMAEKRGRAMTEGATLTWGDRVLIRFVFEPLIYARLRDALGAKLRYAISGGAPLNPALGLFFRGSGIPVLEGYGLTETAPVISLNPTSHPLYGTVGTVLPNLEVRLAADGEILCRGESVMMGYWNDPEATRAVMTGGWLATGDLGAWVAGDYLKIIDRKKALLVLSTGKNVVPQAVEQALATSPYLEQAIVLGDGQKYVAALLVPEWDEFYRWARHQGLPETPDTLDHPAWQALLQQEVQRTTTHLADFERPKRWVLLPRSLSEAAGELTPSLKVKVRVVLEHFPTEVTRLYPEDSFVLAEQRA